MNNAEHSAFIFRSDPGPGTPVDAEASQETTAMQRRRRTADGEGLVFNKLHVQEGKVTKHRKLSKQQLLHQAEAAQTTGLVGCLVACMQVPCLQT
jgi:hypothetical protein